ncbi:MAG: universal stress protein [Solirubrobacteraceae bacterium]
MCVLVMICAGKREREGQLGSHRQPDGRAVGWRRIVVIIDDPETSVMTLQHAVAAARRQRARLTIVSVTPRPWPTVVIAGMCPRRLEAEAMERLATRVRRLAETVPADVLCTTIVRCGRAFKEILAILTEHPYDLVFFAPGLGCGFVGPVARWKAVRLMRMARIDCVLLVSPSAAPVRSSDDLHALDGDSLRLGAWTLAQASVQ